MINLDHLDPDQRQAATAPRGPVAILAGAGTGKTRTITYRIAHQIDQGIVSPHRVMAVTFTKRAAGEMSHRLRLMGIGGVQAKTFHAAALRQLSYFWPQIAGNTPWKMLDRKFPVMAGAMNAIGLDTSPEKVRDVLSEVEWAKASLVWPDHYVTRSVGRSLPAPAEAIAEAYRRYEQAKQRQDGILLDFDDLLVNVAAAIENNPAIAEEFRHQYRSFVVDEYQDVTPLQQRVLDAWLGERDELTVVGDANQTIYSFAGASPGYLLGFSSRYRHATVVKLQRDYRSTPQVTQLANAVIGQAKGRAAGSRLELKGMQEPGPEPRFITYSDEPAEARGVAKAIQRLIGQGVAPREIAVLYRTNSQSEAYEQALSELDISYLVKGGEQFFERREVKEVIAGLVKLHGLGHEHMAVDRALDTVLAATGWTPEEPEGAQARERWQSVKSLRELCVELARATPDLDVGLLLTQLRQRADAKHPPTLEGVTLASLHASKGLEWDAVFLVGLTEGFVPISHAIKAGDDAVEEERRLFYVGITRARRYLCCSWALARHEGGRAGRQRTRFLNGIVAEDPPPQRRTGSATKPKRCTGCGAPLETPEQKILGRCATCPGSADPGFVAELRAWRATVSGVLGAPAFTVFSDATLMAIADQMPTTEEQLLRISGIGPVKVERFGAEVLRLVAEFRAGGS